MKRSQELGFDDDGRPILITAAAPAYEVQHRQRVRKYLTIMSFRIPALLLAAFAYGLWHNGLISLAIIARRFRCPGLQCSSPTTARRAGRTNLAGSTAPNDGLRCFPRPSCPALEGSQSSGPATGMAARAR